MDLHSGTPYWIVKNKLYDYYNPLQESIKTDVVIIGSGITGSLVAHELSNAGIQCTMIDKRTLATGSSAASTSQLQYEIDVPLVDLIQTIGEEKAIKAYHDCLHSINDIKKVFEKIDFNPDFSQVPTHFIASNSMGLDLLEREYKVRKQAGLPVHFLDDKLLNTNLGISKLGALYNETSAQMDSYKGAVSLIKYHKKNSNLKVYTHTCIEKRQKTSNGFELLTSSGHKISCSYLIIAAGFEAGSYIPKKSMKLLSTYALISQPLNAEKLWKNKSLIWETQNPYLYMRTTADNRIIVGGEDMDMKNPVKRDAMMRTKIKCLEDKFKDLFPQIPLITDMSWCGTFSSTPTGLPILGSDPRDKNLFFALGYGGNGITFSMIGAQMIRNAFLGIKDDRENLYKLSIN
ncbi:MAG: FAD-binding oxidoreductase [Flavobacterium sp.]|nr:FAD-binding oxidoreductase [Candidatus Neoflavobacterium equi]